MNNNKKYLARVRQYFGMTIWFDLKYAIRLLSNNFGFTLFTILLLATGLSLSVYLFSFMNTMNFKTMPFKDGNSLVQISSSQNGARNASPIRVHDYNEIRSKLRGISEFSAYRTIDLNVQGRGGARRYRAVSAEPNIFQVTRTKPLLGREFTDADNKIGAQNIVVISYDIWLNQFAGDPHIIEQSLRINNVNHRIIGVMPQAYVFPDNTELWIPLRAATNELTRSGAGNVYGIAHLDAGVSKRDVNRQLTVIMQRIEDNFPETNKGISAYIATIPLASTAGGVLAVIYSLHVIAILVMILASINVGNLLTSRAIERGKETAIRVALGASRVHLISQMLWESIIICGIGGILGLAVLASGLDITQTFIETFFIDGPPFWFIFGIDSYTIKLFSLFLLGTMLIAGLLPAWKNSGADFNAVLRDGTRGALSIKAGRLNKLLVISAIFVSITVLIAALVVLVGNYKAARADYGANPEGIISAEITLNTAKYNSYEKRTLFADTLQSRLENSVGIGGVMISSALPGVETPTLAVNVEGNDYSSDKTHPRANYIVVTPGSLSKLGVKLIEGRYFNYNDNGSENTSAIVTKSFVARHFPNESPIGKRIRTMENSSENNVWLTVIGVVEHTIQGAPYGDRGKVPSIFRPFSQAPRHQITVAMKIKTNSAAVIRSLRKTLASIDPTLPVFKIEPYSDSIMRHTRPMLFITLVFLLFGITAVILAVTGIYGVTSKTILQRTREIGVKRALGAVEKRIINEFLLSGFKQLLWGGIPGLIAGSTMGFAMLQILGVGITDLFAVVFALTIIIGATVMIASYLPTKRVLRMEPSEALRYE